MKQLQVKGMLLILFASLWCSPEYATGKERSMFDNCMLKEMRKADANVTIGEMQQQCLQKIDSKSKGKMADRTDAPKEKTGEGAVNERIAIDYKTILAT